MTESTRLKGTFDSDSSTDSAKIRLALFCRRAGNEKISMFPEGSDLDLFMYE